MGFLQAWPLPGAASLRDALLAAYADPARAYHDQRHLAEVIDRLGELAANGERFEDLPVRLAAWFHDAVYDGRPNAEERSARWAGEALVGLVDERVRTEVQRLVRVTTDHLPATGDRNGAALCDADLAILAAPEARYLAYAAGVRREYGHLDDQQFAVGRAAVLRELAARRALFTTSHGRVAWEPRARANLTRELRRLG